MQVKYETDISLSMGLVLDPHSSTAAESKVPVAPGTESCAFTTRWFTHTHTLTATYKWPAISFAFYAALIGHNIQ